MITGATWLLWLLGLAAPSSAAFPPAAMSAELSHVGLVLLVDHGRQQQQALWHTGTGEVVLLQDRRLLAIENGIATLRREQADDSSEEADEFEEGRAQQVGELFNLSLHEKVVNGEVVPDSAFIFNKAEGNSALYTELAIDIVPKVFDVNNQNGQFKCEVYEFVVPPGYTGHKRAWVCPFVQQAVWGNDCHNRWICRHYKAWLALGRPLGYETSLSWGIPAPFPEGCSGH